ncbi:uncharacterized protein LOC110464002 [Mizuhopecten yessoensis]|uniref:Sushi domain-containing protein n=1 Tax=Mizuhopecten yessoensis TaxID=6573 RepID=A0A210PUX1_MIZYE|nr:uncharacterized protein LOC110464002 [Mizuhopecten yessoensis]OWF40291.1 hypothetical protein KP79_PYT16843 [Mizuhopecten yessoensis]
MKFEEFICAVLLLLCTIHQFVLTQKSYEVDYSSFRPGKQMRPSSIFLTVNRFTIVRCIKECLKYRRCGAITFSSLDSRCDLGDARPTILTVNDQNTMTSGQYWTPPEAISGNCVNHNCSNEERCMDFTNEPVRCQTFECPPYVGITHSIETSTGARAFGQEFPIVCPGGFLPNFVKTTCGEDGQWTMLTSVSCLNCTTPIYKNNTIVSCYNYPSLAKQTYASAKNVCEAVGGKLPRIDGEVSDSYFRTATDGVYWIEGGTETDADSMQYDDGTVITYRNYEVTNTTICGVNATECGIAMSSSANDNQMFIKDKTTDPQLVVCQMVLG